MVSVVLLVKTVRLIEKSVCIMTKSLRQGGARFHQPIPGADYLPIPVYSADYTLARAGLSYRKGQGPVLQGVSCECFCGQRGCRGIVDVVLYATRKTS